MKSAPSHPQEELRIEVLHALNILDSVAEAQFDAITRIASSICGTPIALVSLVDIHRQRFKAAVGLPAAVRETSRDSAFCAHAILDSRIMEVKDASTDARFHDNPLVTGAPNIKFYAGRPLVVGGLPVGTLCVIDQVPRQLTAQQRNALEYLGDLVQSLLEEKRLRSITDDKQRQIDEEMELAREVLNNLTHAGSANKSFRKAILPATKFSGDLITAMQAPNGNLMGLFADVTGHGLSSALYQIPAVDTFKAQVAAGKSVGEIARAINLRLKALARTGHFMAAIIFEYEPSQHRLTIWNGGMPCAWLLDQFGMLHETVASSHLALGILPDDAFDETATVIHDPQVAQFLMVSDGIIEAANDQGEEFGEGRALMSQRDALRGSQVETMLSAVFAHQGSAPQHDDMAVALLTLDIS
jgi:serine phosphatase RsbU (regulator of sigma subunit)